MRKSAVLTLFNVNNYSSVTLDTGAYTSLHDDMAYGIRNAIHDFPACDIGQFSVVHDLKDRRWRSERNRHYNIYGLDDENGGIEGILRAVAARWPLLRCFRFASKEEGEYREPKKRYDGWVGLSHLSVAQGRSTDLGSITAKNAPHSFKHLRKHR